jgi:hypothetical protein
VAGLLLLALALAAERRALAAHDLTAAPGAIAKVVRPPKVKT